MINAVIPQLTSLHLSGNLLTLALFLFGLSGTAGWTQSVHTSQPVSLHGAGSTFAAPFYRKLIEEYGLRKDEEGG